MGSYQSTNMNQRRSNERSFDLDTKKKNRNRWKSLDVTEAKKTETFIDK